MKNNASLIYNVLLIIGDFLALVGAFSIAYILRVSVSHQQISTPIRALAYLETFLAILPFFILFFGLLGLYSREIYEQRFRETGRLIVGVFLGILFIISYGYVFNIAIFPARLVIVYGYILALLLILIFRNLLRFARRKYPGAARNAALDIAARPVGETALEEGKRILAVELD